MVTEERRSGKLVRRELFIAGKVTAWPRWTGARGLVRVRRTVLDSDGEVIQVGERSWVTSLEPDALTPDQWLRVCRGHWGVENNGHNTWDAVLRKDQRPWITTQPNGTLVLMMLRRLAYDILTLHRTVTMRSDNNRKTPWRELMRWFYNALIAATAEQLGGLRELKPPLPA